MLLRIGDARLINSVLSHGGRHTSPRVIHAYLSIRVFVAKAALGEGPLVYDGPMDVDLTALEGSVLQSIADRDWDALRDLLSEDFVITTAGWLSEPVGKDTWLDATQGHLLNSFDIASVDVRDFGDVAVALVLSSQSGTWARGPFAADFRYTDVWRRSKDGSWLLTVRHATLIPSAGTQDS